MSIVITAGQRGDSPQLELVLNMITAGCAHTTRMAYRPRPAAASPVGDTAFVFQQLLADH